MNLAPGVFAVRVVSLARTCEARAVMGELMEQSRQRYVPSYYPALIQVGLDEKERAFEFLENAYAERSTLLTSLKMDPRLAPLRSDPRYADLVKRIGFPQ